jgi:hypothetical protein
MSHDFFPWGHATNKFTKAKKYRQRKNFEEDRNSLAGTRVTSGVFKRDRQSLI